MTSVHTHIPLYFVIPNKKFSNGEGVLGGILYREVLQIDNIV